eukprot:Phypoly_transcript_04220.p1 GENE.Phypoly_transcript_04220~~Phypoly_transcript_04220.p1  ORF type:complete len:672 (+),score=106.92 Phypoly_transcript_04220:130-2145(+)
MSEFITSRVVLYKNGIGNFERTGTVDKDTTIELFFPSDAMNDILKSINVTSSDNHKHAITYEVPSSSTSALPPISTHKDLYTRLVRETVLIRTAESIVEGMVLAVDYSNDPNICGKISIFTKENQIVNLPISAIVSMQVPNSLVSQSKSLKINITAQKKQEIKITYIRSCPVWKPTYRAVLGTSATEYKLYGWATIHNPGVDDWQGTLISLVAGQPVSFINEVYKPKYRRRPKIQTTNIHTPLGISGLLVSSLLDESDTSSSDSDTDDTPVGRKKAPVHKHAGRARARDLSRSASRSESRSRSRSPTGTIESTSAGGPTPASTADSETVDLFRYDLVTPVNLTHGHSALVPIFDAVVHGRKVALFNTTLHKDHPFSTLVLSNTTGLSLEAGSITVFDGDMYIGEAHLIATKPNERRFLPFALELGVLVQSLPIACSQQPVHHVLVERCQVAFSRKSIKIYHYVITNKSEKSIELLLEHPKEWSKPVGSVSLIVEECYHGTDKNQNKIDVKTEYVTGSGSTGNYGFNFTIPPRSTTHFVLHSQFVDRTLDSLRDSNRFKHVLEDGPLLSQLIAVLAPYSKLEQHIADIERSIHHEKERLSELENSQARARSNLTAIRELDKQKRYTEQLDNLEDEINKSHAKIKDLTTQLLSSRTNLKLTGDALYFDSSSSK